MPSITLDPIAFLSVLAALNAGYIAFFTWIEGASLLTARLFSALALVTAWWGLCLGLAFSSAGMHWPELLQMSQLLSGFFGPLLLLYSLSAHGWMTRLDGRWRWLLLPGLFGTASFIGLLLFEPPNYDRVARTFLGNEGPFDYHTIADGAPWYLLLQRLHGIELIVNTLAALAVAIAAMTGYRNRRAARHAPLDTAVFIAMLIGILLTVIAPAAGYPAWLIRLAPVIPLPFLWTMWRFLRKRIETAERLMRQRRVLLSYLPSPAIDRMLENTETGRGHKAEAAVLFSDLRGFTTLSERVDPIELVEWMDAFFSHATATVLDELGMVDKLIGDTVLAVFGIPEALDNPAERAVRCAFRLDQVLQDLVAERPLGDVRTIRMGIGIHYGPLVAGSIGSDARRTFTVFGDTVNTASRLEGMTKVLGRELIISETSWEQLSPSLQRRFEALGRHDIRGRSGGIFLYGARLRQQPPHS